MSLALDAHSVLNPRIVVPAASAVTYLIYKTFEPSTPLSALLLLGAVPAFLVATLLPHFSTPITAALAVCTTYWLLIAAFTVGYRLSPFHPLARYPGPTLCKVSKLWIAYLAGTERKIHLYMQQLHQQYGEVVRIGPNELSISHKDIGDAVLGAKGLPRGPYYDTRQHEAGVSLDGLRDPALHVVRRRPWARGMNSASMKYYEELIRSTVGDLLSSLRQRTNDTVDISAWMTFFGFDFMGHMAFTYDYGMLKNGKDVSGLYTLVEGALMDAAWVSHIPWALAFVSFLPGATKKWDEMKVVGEKTAEYRLSLGSTHRDLFHHLMDEDGHERVKPSLDLVAVDGQLAIIAGGDTAATTLSHLWYFLLSNPECMKRLRQEVDQAFPRGEDTTTDFAKQVTMPYLNACINETLRLYPPVLAGLQRRVQPGSGGKMIGDYYIPEQTQISLSAYAIQRDPQHYSPLPNTFWPDRWLTQDKYTLPSGDVVSGDQVITSRDVFIPFSQGPMVCAGKNVALAEIRAVACAILQQFEISVVDRSYLDTWESKLQEIFTTKRGTLPVRLTPRT